MLVLGVSLSYILVSCGGKPSSEQGVITVDIMPVLPAVSITQTNYEKDSLPISFYKPEVIKQFTSVYGATYNQSLKESMVELTGINIKNLGGDSDNFIACMNSIEFIKDIKSLPCVVESAKYDGKDAWIMLFNYGNGENDFGHTAYCAVEKSTQKTLYWGSSI